MLWALVQVGVSNVVNFIVFTAGRGFSHRGIPVFLLVPILAADVARIACHGQLQRSRRHSTRDHAPGDPIGAPKDQVDPPKAVSAGHGLVPVP